MYYSAIGVLAAILLLIENWGILKGKNPAFDIPVWKVYRRFLYSVLIYYVTDILWGVLEDAKLAVPLFADTTIYFIAMASGILFWTQYVVEYLNEKKGFGRVILAIGHSIALFVMLVSVINIFIPLLFTIDEFCVYRELAVRNVVLAAQILTLILISVYAFSGIYRQREAESMWQRYRMIGSFGIIMALFLFAQLCFPLLPAYSIAYMLGTSLLHISVVRIVREEYQIRLNEAEKFKELKHSISSLLDNMPALSFYKDAKTGVYLACNQAFADYANKKSPADVIGLTDAQIFDKDTAAHFSEGDAFALSIEMPYIFYEEVPDGAGNVREFQTTKQKFTDVDGRLCLLGMCQDVTDLVRIQRENVKTREAYETERNNGIIYNHIAQTLARSYEDLYYIHLDTEEFTEYRTDETTGALTEVRRGKDFFSACMREAGLYIHPEDRSAFMKALERDNLIDSLNRNGFFFMTYRLLKDSGSTYVSMKVSRMEDDDRVIILGVMDVDEQTRQRRAAERVKEEHIAYARLNALAGDFICVYVVDPETDYYREFSSTKGFQDFEIPKEGADFFNAACENGKKIVYPDDLERYLAAFTKEGVLSEIERCGLFSLTYRFLIDGKPNYVQLKAAMLEESDGERLVIGINDIDHFVRQEKDYARRLAQAQTKANIDAMTGVKNKHAYLDEEQRLDLMIAEHHNPDFAIVILDVNDLKKVNDTLGHKAGDQYICDASRLICETFKRSPVYRVGGDEFAVVVLGEDYKSLEDHLGRISDHNREAGKIGGLVVACGASKYKNDACTADVFERADTAMYEDKRRLKEGLPHR
ncbi:MAG: diguanylate cyclase [Lachnospiraceae bacterium]|nr:diguanylate cyclase [Lachnospiraceae bacterium]